MATTAAGTSKLPLADTEVQLAHVILDMEIPLRDITPVAVLGRITLLTPEPPKALESIDFNAPQ